MKLIKGFQAKIGFVIVDNTLAKEKQPVMSFRVDLPTRIYLSAMFFYSHSAIIVLLILLIFA